MPKRLATGRSANKPLIAGRSANKLLIARAGLTTSKCMWTLLGIRLLTRLSTKRLEAGLTRMARMMTRLTGHGRRCLILSLSQFRCDILHIFFGQRMAQGFPDYQYCGNGKDADSLIGFQPDILFVNRGHSARDLPP